MNKEDFGKIFQLGSGASEK